MHHRQHAIQTGSAPAVVRLSRREPVFPNVLYVVAPTGVPQRGRGCSSHHAFIASRGRSPFRSHRVLLHARPPAPAGRGLCRRLITHGIRAAFKQRSSFHWRQCCGKTLWQRSYYEHVLRNEESTLDVARYILENPVRAGLATRVEDYPYVGSMTLSIKDLLFSVSDDR
jgi:hypothetical protein